MYKNYKELPELKHLSDADKLKTYKDKTWPWSFRIPYAIFVGMTLVFSINAMGINYDRTNAVETFIKALFAAMYPAAIVYLVLLFKLNTMDRIILRDFMNKDCG